MKFVALLPTSEAFGISLPPKMRIAQMGARG